MSGFIFLFFAVLCGAFVFGVVLAFIHNKMLGVLTVVLPVIAFFAFAFLMTGILPGTHILARAIGFLSISTIFLDFIFVLGFIPYYYLKLRG